MTEAGGGKRIREITVYVSNPTLKYYVKSMVCSGRILKLDARPCLNLEKCQFKCGVAASFDTLKHTKKLGPNPSQSDKQTNPLSYTIHSDAIWSRS